MDGDGDDETPGRPRLPRAVSVSMDEGDAALNACIPTAKQVIDYVNYGEGKEDGLMPQLRPQLMWFPISLFRELEGKDEDGEDGDESLLAAALALSLGKDAVDDNEEKHDAHD